LIKIKKESLRPRTECEMNCRNLYRSLSHQLVKKKEECHQRAKKDSNLFHPQKKKKGGGKNISANNLQKNLPPPPDREIARRSLKTKCDQKKGRVMSGALSKNKGEDQKAPPGRETNPKSKEKRQPEPARKQTNKRKSRQD